MRTPRNIIECENTNCRNCLYEKEINLEDPNVCHIRRKFQEEYNNIIVNDQEHKAVVAIIEAVKNMMLKETNRETGRWFQELKQQVQQVFDHKFVTRCEQELMNAKRYRKDLDTTSFIIGFVSGANVAMEIETEL